MDLNYLLGEKPRRGDITQHRNAGTSFFISKICVFLKKSSTFAAESPVVPDASQTIGCRPF